MRARRVFLALDLSSVESSGADGPSARPAPWTGRAFGSLTQRAGAHWSEPASRVPANSGAGAEWLQARFNYFYRMIRSLQPPREPSAKRETVFPAALRAGSRAWRRDPSGFGNLAFTGLKYLLFIELEDGDAERPATVAKDLGVYLVVVADRQELQLPHCDCCPQHDR